MSTGLGAPPDGRDVVSSGERRMARVLLVVGLLLSALYMLLFAALPELARHG
jgi:hypothetical protein